MKTNLIEYVNNRLTKPKDKKDLRTPSKEKNLNGEERLAQNKFMIFSYSNEKDKSTEKIQCPSVLKIDVIKKKKSKTFSQIGNEKWISSAEKNNLDTKDKGF